LAASVGTDSSGRYRITVLDKFRGLEVTVNARAIGFVHQSRTIRLVTRHDHHRLRACRGRQQAQEVIVHRRVDATELKKLGFT
jgi:hypothetical protein